MKTAYLTEEQLLFLKENALYFIHVNDKLYPMGKAKEIIGKSSITWDEFDFGISQKLVKQGYKIAITEAKTPKRVEIWNNAASLSPEEIKLVKIYPHYFLNFITNNGLDNLLSSRNDINYIADMSDSIKTSAYEEKNKLKEKLSNWLLNHDAYKTYLHRFVQDFILPNFNKQNYVNKLKNRQKPTNDEFELYGNLNIYKYGIPSENNYIDFLIP